LLGFDHQKMVQAGNTALRGTKMMLFNPVNYNNIINKTEHIPLAADMEFQNVFVENMTFSNY